MSGPTNRAGVLSPSPSSILDRASLSSQSELQSQVDSLVSHSIAEATNTKTLTAMVAGGFAFRFARTGGLAAADPLLKGNSILSWIARGGSYAAALGAESAVFAGV